MQVTLQFFMGLFSALVGLASITKTRAHTLSILLSLELISLSIYLMITSVNSSTFLSFSSLYLVVVAVGEGTLGISLLIYLVSVHNSGNTKSFSLP